MPNQNTKMMQRDLEVIWHPCTQMKDHETLPLIPVKSGKGVYLYDFDGNSYIDAVSSWWVNLFGHANEIINAKIKAQLETLEHVLLAGFTHEPAIELAHKLVEITPSELVKVFYVDNGSSAVEAALKMSYHYHLNQGKCKPIFLSLTNSYHGETIGALSVGDVKLYKETYEPLLIANMQVPVPKDQSIEAAQTALLALEEVLCERGDEIAAFILEPLIQGAGGMHMYHPVYLEGARALTLQYDVHLIADEIMTGFGRTGKMFACEYAGISPDFMTLSKGITGGYLPLSVVMTTLEVYNAFYCDYNEYKAFLHSHSYTGNPLACAAALATLEIFENNDVLGENAKKSHYIKAKLSPFSALPNVKEIRQQGMVAAVELQGYETSERIGLKVYEYALSQGVLLRPLGAVIYFMPPYIITYEEIDKMIEVAYAGIKSVSKPY
ncbi:MAG: adenosylmethionine--8-amino-7-oxononanoate transaminase [Sulfurovum sp. 39-42-12]|nr:MAG: adenosylmethionine--8-amino-7-oxononanoate transaminase [Sulfurovum sp. 35-42-20]OYZ50339.1 MAG: adenosylmethionine--8-amino-7-oxononanoate transaminase [Sulfurovum sp. 24-42-9]OZA43500.1 MAG: adenosylmethionine--8-amino-7-oxononanoate transaminase [Sulfurovum sp. 17-42-90]OZA60662.1 MAG: adenosylmethionine--8-amino-7-oxononanoate transaminase [Sulfurovum sp. 39-42-12]